MRHVCRLVSVSLENELLEVIVLLLLEGLSDIFLLGKMQLMLRMMKRFILAIGMPVLGV